MYSYVLEGRPKSKSGGYFSVNRTWLPPQVRWTSESSQFGCFRLSTYIRVTQTTRSSKFPNTLHRLLKNSRQVVLTKNLGEMGKWNDQKPSIYYLPALYMSLGSQYLRVKDSHTQSALSSDILEETHTLLISCDFSIGPIAVYPL